MTLVPALSDAELRRVAAARQLQRFGRVIDGCDVALAGPSVAAAQADAGLTAPIRARREGDTLWLEIETPPRSKKNHGRRVYARKQKRVVHVPSPAYEKYRADVMAAIATVQTALGLPLPDQAYNLAIHYYVDGYGARADRPGLDQGLFDALQDAGVVSDDWFFRSTEGTPPPITGDDRPRFECVITPIALPAVAP